MKEINELLVTGSSGLVGSKVSRYFAHELGYRVRGLDNSQCAVFLGRQATRAGTSSGCKKNCPQRYLRCGSVTSRSFGERVRAATTVKRFTVKIDEPIIVNRSSFPLRLPRSSPKAMMVIR